MYRYDGAGDTLAGTERLNGFSSEALVSVATEDTVEQVVEAFVTAETQPPRTTNGFITVPGLTPLPV